MIEAIDLTKVYGKAGVRAVNSLNLSVSVGELFGFLGPNGAGKTTTIKMLVGLLEPTSGVAKVAGFDLATNPLEAKSRIGYVPDNPYLYDKLTGSEFLDFISDLYSMPSGKPRAEKAAGLMRLLDLEGRENLLISSYSRGMRQKMALAAALMHDPKVLFLDEPTVGLDPNSTRRLKDILRGLCQAGTTVFLSTHILEVASEICDRVGIFHQGRLVELDTPAELASRSASGRLEEVFLSLTGAINESDAELAIE